MGESIVKRNWSLALAFLVPAGAGVNVAQAQTYPARPIRVEVPFAPGGAQDVIVRLVSQRAAGALGQPIVVENKAGAGGIIAAETVAKATPDGYTLLMASGGQVSVASAVQPKLGYDPLHDLVPVVQLVDTPMVLVVPQAMPVTSVAEFIALARQKPGMLSFASTGSGTISHLTGEAFKHAAGIDILHVPYKGASQGLSDLLAGQVNAMFTSAASAQAYLSAGRLRALGVAGGTRLPILPKVPTFTEAGLKDFVIPVWAGIMVPRGTPPGIVARLQKEYTRALQNPEVRQQLEAMGAVVVGNTPEQFSSVVQQDAMRWKAVVAKGNVKLD
jgi:tripartite-type tricarboxylate transporter receptor subunit TctC